MILEVGYYYFGDHELWFGRLEIMILAAGNYDLKLEL